MSARRSDVNGYFCQYVLDYLANAGLSGDAIANGGYTINTTLDPAKMAGAHQAVLAQVPLTAANKKVANVMAVVAPGSPRKVVALTANRPYGLDAVEGPDAAEADHDVRPAGRRFDVQDLHRGGGDGGRSGHAVGHPDAGRPTRARSPRTRSRTPPTTARPSRRR